MLLTDFGRALCVLTVAGGGFGPELSMLTVMALTAVLGGLEGLFPAPVLRDPAGRPERRRKLPPATRYDAALESAASFVAPPWQVWW